MVKFKVASFDEEAEFIFELKNSLTLTEGARKKRCIFLNMGEELKKELLSAKKLNKDILTKIIKEERKQTNSRIEKQIRLKLKKIKKDWGKIEEEYLSFIKRITNINIKNIICYITRYIIGSYYFPNKVVVNYKSKIGPYVLAEEIFHLYYWKVWDIVFKKNYSHLDPFELKGKKWTAWHVSELIPEFFLVNNKNLKIFYDKKIDRSISYPWLDEIKKDVGKIKVDNLKLKKFIKEIHKKLGIKV